MTTDRPASAGTGYLRRNDKKTRPSQPDHVGSSTVAGTKYFVSAWINEGDDGKKFFKLSFTPAPEERSEEQRPPERGGPSFDSDIPFEMEWR